MTPRSLFRGVLFGGALFGGALFQSGGVAPVGGYVLGELRAGPAVLGELSAQPGESSTTAGVIATLTVRASVSGQFGTEG